MLMLDLMFHPARIKRMHMIAVSSLTHLRLLKDVLLPCWLIFMQWMDTWRWHPAMNRGKHRVPLEGWRKSSQWMGLIRKHAELFVQDQVIDELFRSYCSPSNACYSGRKPLLPFYLFIDPISLLLRCGIYPCGDTHPSDCMAGQWPFWNGLLGSELSKGCFSPRPQNWKLNRYTTEYEPLSEQPNCQRTFPIHNIRPSHMCSFAYLLSLPKSLLKGYDTLLSAMQEASKVSKLQAFVDLKTLYRTITKVSMWQGKATFNFCPRATKLWPCRNSWQVWVKTKLKRQALYCLSRSPLRFFYRCLLSMK